MTTFVDCPQCGLKLEWTAENRYRPFCSARCKQIDLGTWAEEKYVIPSTDQPENGNPEDNSVP
jgi:uncharacterized protein